ncbi:VCBS repeat-containing protein [Seonamhaeicola sp. MEBiC1930]|uniref:VCBS repeat-containing protein n=1 Tax=Seonamhaeicola sp. MEBiC01930 TaxID=2976768 RepID=UPI0032556EBA
MFNRKSIIYILIILVFLSCNSKLDRNIYPDTLNGGLELLSPEITGVNFNNSIKESTTLNMFFYSQIYNGAGVAIGDINNDELPDIFFCGNQVSDRLYLNKGEFKFDDITKKSKAAINAGWSWGVTMADVNSDGYLDIYVSRNGESMSLEDRKNQLYINNQDLTFTESAMKYGLADPGFSTQAVFFDMDNDGDLDMYQVNQPPDAKLFKRYSIDQDTYKHYTDKLYKNENGRYKDVSSAAGIEPRLAYGLAVCATDFNNDGWTDLYVTNDYDEPDFMLYNNGDGTFKNVIDKNLKHISRFSMGADTGDINNDGLIDLITLDMAAEDHYRSKTNMGSMSTEEFNKIVNKGDHYQYMFNTLQINSGRSGFYDVANIAGIGKTDWSWGSLIVDLDNDGLKDILVSNGIPKDVRNNDFVDALNNVDENITIEEFFNMTNLAPSSPLPNYVFKNKGDLQFKKVSKDWTFNTPSFSNGISYGDLDNDGDLDVVTNNMGSPAFIYKNKATGNFLKLVFDGPKQNTFGYGAKATIHYNNSIQTAVNTVTRGYFSSIEPGLFFGLGKEVEVENIEVVWPDGKKNTFDNVDANSTLIVKYDKAEPANSKQNLSKGYLLEANPSALGINFQHNENNYDEYTEEILLPHNISQNGPFTAVADVNGDNLEDLFIGGAVGQSGVLYIQNEKGKFEKSNSQPWNDDKLSEDLGCVFFDIDGDNDFDLYVASGGSEYKQGSKYLQDRLYINDGNGNFNKGLKNLPPIKESSQCVKVSDVDKDGDFDLFVGTRLISGKYTHPATSYILLNNSNGTFKKVQNTVAPDLQNIGMVTDAVFTDIDNDDDQDLILVGEWMAVTILENDKGKFKLNSEKFGLNKGTKGLWWSITANDIDNDGDDDYILGNLGKNNKFKASVEHPFKVYANDFDDNGTNDIVLAKFYKEDYVPLRGRECTSQQMPYVTEKFKDYHSFASSKLYDILPDKKIENAVIHEISSFESIVLINDSGILKRKVLPIQAQLSPLKSSTIVDINKDGFKDIVSVGNHYGVEVETTRYDAGFGTVLLGDGKNNFRYISPKESGFYVPNDSRNINKIKSSDNNLLFIISNNNNETKIFSFY